MTVKSEREATDIRERERDRYRKHRKQHRLRCAPANVLHRLTIMPVTCVSTLQLQWLTPSAKFCDPSQRLRSPLLLFLLQFASALWQAGGRSRRTRHTMTHGQRPTTTSRHRFRHSPRRSSRRRHRFRLSPRRSSRRRQGRHTMMHGQWQQHRRQWQRQ